jgi:hypothetical protein
MPVVFGGLRMGVLSTGRARGSDVVLACSGRVGYAIGIVGLVNMVNVVSAVRGGGVGGHAAPVGHRARGFRGKRDTNDLLIPARYCRALPCSAS